MVVVDRMAAAKSMGLFVGYTLPFLIYLLPLPFAIIDSLTVLQIALIVAAGLLTKSQSNTDLQIEHMGTKVKLSGHLLCLIHQTSAGVLIGVLITIPGIMLSDPKHIYTLTL